MTAYGSGDCETRWDTKTETTHLGETGALAAQKGLHGDRAVGGAVAEGEDMADWGGGGGGG